MHQLWRINSSSPTTDEFGPLVYGYAYGLGWRKDARGIIRISHSGGLPGYGSEWRIYPDYGIGVVSFSNRRYGAPSNANAKVIDTLVALADLKPRVLPVSRILENVKPNCWLYFRHGKNLPNSLLRIFIWTKHWIFDRRKLPNYLIQPVL